MRATVLGFGLAALVAAPSGALPGRYYQHNVYKQCSGGVFCEVAFPQAPANRVLTIAHASCRVYLSSRSAIVSHVQLQSDRNDGRFFLGLTTIANAESRNFVAELQGPVAISPGARPRIALYASGASTVSLECGIAGALAPIGPEADADADADAP